MEAAHDAIGGVPLPSFLQIEPVGRCNLRCRMCPVQFRPETHGRAPATMDFDTYRRLLDGFPTLTELHLQGLGEPLMHPRFFDMVRHARARGIRVSTNTNLTLLSEARAQQAVSCGLAEISVSIDAATAAVYESIRLGARLHKVLRNLKRLMRARAAVPHGAPDVRIVMVLMRRTLPELPRLIEVAHDMGVDALFVQQLSHDFAESTLPAAYRTMREFIDREMLDESDRPAMEDISRAAIALALRLGVALRLPRAPARASVAPVHGCDWPWRGAYLSWRGEAMPCCMVSTPDRVRLGDMAAEGVEAVWNGSAYARFRAALASGTPPEICRTCSLYRGSF
jgi:MoaA/NifB/PqqE/SkfB family radical SAM enzyme